MFRSEYLLAFLFLLLFGACSQDEVVTTPDSGQNQASLNIKVGIPDVVLETRATGMSDDPALSSRLLAENAQNQNDLWAPWYRLVDGRMLYKLTLFLVQDNRVVSYCDISRPVSGTSFCQGQNSSGTIAEDGKTATASFANLQDGDYTLLAVANYSGATAEDENGDLRQYAGNSQVSLLVFNLINDVITGTATTASASYQNLFNATISTDESLICKPEPQMLTLRQPITLVAGGNNASATLRRTFARIRIVVHNNSNDFLEIRNFHFSDDFAQREAYIFDHTGVGTGNYVFAKGNVDVTSPNAIIPFSEDVNPLVNLNTSVIPGVDQSASRMVRSNRNYGVPFDAYVLENEYTQDPSYVMELIYPDVKTVTTVYERDGEAISYSDFLADDRQEALYLIRFRSAGAVGSGAVDPNYFLYEDDVRYDQIAALYHFTTDEDPFGTMELSYSPDEIDVDIELMEGNTNFVWSFEKQDTAYAIKNIASGKYLKNVLQGGSLGFVNEMGPAYTIEDAGNGKFRFRNATGTSSLYMNAYCNNALVNSRGQSLRTVYISGYQTADPAELFKVKTRLRHRTLNKLSVMPLAEYNEETKENDVIHQIHRNDFLQVQFSVSYVRSGEDLELEISPWNTVSGEVEFN